MPDWLLAVSRDADLAHAISRVLIRAGARHQLWAVENVGRARRRLADKPDFPSAIVLDELFLGGESLAAVAAELSCFAPLIVIARQPGQALLAPLVAAGKADFVPRDNHYVPLTAALVERTVRWEREVERQIRRVEPAPLPIPDSDGFGEEALRLVGGILDSLEPVFSERPRLSAPTARRLDRLADLAFELKRSLRALAGRPETEVEPIPRR